jgi:hypothetical protein
MKPQLTFDKLKNKLGEAFAQNPEHRKGANKQYSLKDAGLGAFSVFFTQSPSFLAHQRTLQQTKGKSNGESIFGMGKVQVITRCAHCWTRLSPRALKECIMKS